MKNLFVDVGNNDRIYYCILLAKNNNILVHKNFLLKNKKRKHYK